MVSDNTLSALKRDIMKQASQYVLIKLLYLFSSDLKVSWQFGASLKVSYLSFGVKVEGHKEISFKSYNTVSKPQSKEAKENIRSDSIVLLFIHGFDSI